MHVDYAFICDFAEAKDKVNALGIGFDRIYAPKVPAKHPHFSIVLQLKFNRTEAGTKDVRVHLTDADGMDVIPPIKGQLVVNAPPPGVLEATTRMVMEFGNVEFKKYGDYAVRVNIGGQEIASMPISISVPPHKPV